MKAKFLNKSIKLNPLNKEGETKTENTSILDSTTQRYST
jgi:hypothetical protein